MIANALPRPLTAGSVDNAILRADGTGGTILQNSNIVIDDVATATQDNVAILNASSATNSALVLTPKGTGALIAGPKPDGAATGGGNARGLRSVDLQLERALATQVASGDDAIAIGNRNIANSSRAIAIGRLNNAGNSNTICVGDGSTATGNRSICIGSESQAITSEGGISLGRSLSSSGTFSVSIGIVNTANASHATAMGRDALANRVGMFAYASQQFAAQGDAQRARFVLRNKTTTNSAVELFLDGSSTRLTIPSGKIFAFTINIAGVSSTGAAVAHYMRQYCLKNVAATTSEVYAPITIGTDNAAGTSLSLTFNDPADALVVSVTGTASTIWRWVASVDAVEISYGT